MKVEISIDRSYILEKSTLGTQQENKFEKLEFLFPEEINDYTKTIEFQTPDSKYIDNIENDEYIIKNNISKYECVQVQVIAIKDDKVFKSKIFDLYFYKSINATEQIEEEQPDLVHKMILDIENIKDDINNFTSYDDSEIKEDLKNKVDKIKGKGLSTNDYTNEEKQKLAKLNNYDDTELQKKLEQAEKEKALLEKDLLANQVTETVEGNNLKLTDSSSARLVDFEIEGNSEQATRSGKNKFYLTKKETGTKNGVNYTIDGTKITLNGTTTANTDIYFLGSWGSTAQNDKRFLKSGTYTFSCTGAKNNNRFSADIYQNTTNVISLAYKDVQTKTLSEDTYYSVFYISIPANKTFNNEIFKFQLEEGSTATDYEEYGVMPSPDYPSEIKSCGDSGNIELVKSNKNLLNFKPDDYNWSTGKSHTEGTTVTLIGSQAIGPSNRLNTTFNIFIPKGTTITSSSRIIKGKENYTNGWITPNILFNFADGTKNINNDLAFHGAEQKNQIKQKTYTFDKDIVSINVYIGASGVMPVGNTTSQVVIGLQLEEGDTATDYIEHQEQNYTVPVQKPFRAIGDVRDRFVKQDGKRYEEHKIKRINSYNNEEITTAYMSNIGELSTGAVVDYVLETSELIECTAEQCRILDEIENSENYKELTYIYSTDEVQPNLKATYSKDLNTVIAKINDAIIAQGGV